MKTQINRKFLVKDLPDLRKFQKEIWRRFYLFNKDGVEIRIQKINDKFEIERKFFVTALSREEHKIEISETEFNTLKSFSIGEINRDCYLISNKPLITLRIYRGTFKGLVRVEVDFTSEKKAKEFKPLDWFGEEITNSPLGKDSKLLKLSRKEFKLLARGK